MSGAVWCHNILFWSSMPTPNADNSVGWYLGLQIFVRRLDPKDRGADRGRAVGPRSRAIADTFVVATCAAFVPVSVVRSSDATSSARDELIDLAEGSSEGLNPGFWDLLGCSGMSFWTLDND